MITGDAVGGELPAGYDVFLHKIISDGKIIAVAGTRQELMGNYRAGPHFAT